MVTFYYQIYYQLTIPFVTSSPEIHSKSEALTINIHQSFKGEKLPLLGGFEPQEFQQFHHINHINTI